LGQRVYHKGWTVFEELALRFIGDDRYQFFQLGLPDGLPLPRSIRNVPVRVAPEQRHAMEEALKAAQIDVVVTWSLWPETFCFAVHEALAAGAFVVARANAGNVWPAIQAYAPDQGCAIEDEAGLVALFNGSELRTRVEKLFRRSGTLQSGGATAEWLFASAD